MPDERATGCRQPGAALSARSRRPARVAEHREPVPDHVAIAVRRLADELAIPPSDVLRAANSRVVAAFTGEPVPPILACAAARSA